MLVSGAALAGSVPLIFFMHPKHHGSDHPGMSQS